MNLYNTFRKTVLPFDGLFSLTNIIGWTERLFILYCDIQDKAALYK